MGRTLLAVVSLACLAASVQGQTQFIEAETFTPCSDGWKVADSRAASAVKSLHGATGDPKGTAKRTVSVAEAGHYRLWVRYQYHSRFRGPFELAVMVAGAEKVRQVFGQETREADDWDYLWESIDLDLPTGEIELVLSKHQQKNCSSYARHVDCVLLTMDQTLKPNHLDFGPQTYLRVTLGTDYAKPVYVHVFADHYRSPWYSHHHLSKAGTGNGLAPKGDQRLSGGEQTPWCNITGMLYQDSGAILNFSIRRTYHQREERMVARYEFATAPEDGAVVRVMDVKADPNGLVVVMPPNLLTEENRSRMGRDADFAERTGRLADGYDWPTIGRKPQRFPFFVAASIGGYDTPPDQAVTDRERKTLDYFGFSNWTRTYLHGGMWRTKNNSYCEPDLDFIVKRAAERAAELKAAGKTPADVVYCMLMDEPTGQDLRLMAANEAYHEALRHWLESKGLTPADLLVADWQAVRPVTSNDRETLPALYYFSQRFRTQALGEFMAVQRRALEEACGGSFPVNVNFSDGATYHANFYSQGVDYFELLDDDTQNAIWGEDWANGSSSYQCGAYNVDLMRAAARERGQAIGHYLIGHAGRRALDIKLKAAGNVARGAKMLKSFSYGVYWGSHEGGPAWRSHVWQNRPETWRAHAEILREIGAAEDLLLPAMPARAQVAILYSSSSDIWQSGINYAFGFDRMHTWMALAHAQIPVDFVGEEQVSAGQLDGYRVCYLHGPNLTRAAAAKLAAWLQRGGVLIATAGAASRDEYNRPLPTLETLLPAQRGEITTIQAHLGSGRYLARLQPRGQVTVGDTRIDVLSVRQALTAKAGTKVIGIFDDGTPAWVAGQAGQGTVYTLGFLPALDYIRQALVARQALTEQSKQDQDAAIDGEDATDAPKAEGAAAISADDRARLADSANPWAYPAPVRDAILAPVRAAKLDPPLTCSTPLVDAVYMTCDRGIVVPLANYTLRRLAKVDFTLRVDRPVTRLSTVHRGEIPVKQQADRISLSIPLASTDYILVEY